MREKNLEHSELSSNIEGLFESNSDRLLSLGIHIDKNIETKIAPEEKKKHLKAFLNRFLRRGILTLGLASALLAVGVAPDIFHYLETRYKVKELKDGDDVVFAHEDPKTTEIINFLSGREDLTEKTKLELTREEIIRILGDKDRGFVYHPPEKFYGMNETQLRLFFLDIFNSSHEWKLTAEDAEAILKIPEKSKYNKAIYKYLWQVEHRAGNPKIAWRNGNTALDYDPKTNTIFIRANADNSASLVNSYLAEAAHGIQNEQSPLGFSLRGLRDDTITLLNSIKSGKSFGEEYTKQYSKPGSIEHEAHQEIQPRLEKDLPER